MNCSVSGCNHQAWKGRKLCFRHIAPSREMLCRVYQIVRENPRTITREISQQLHISNSTTFRALCALDRVGAVRKPERKVARGLVVLPAAIYDNEPYRALWLDLDNA